MAIFSVSDIIIAITLIINSLALMSTKISELLTRLSSDLRPDEPTPRRVDPVAVEVTMNDEYNEESIYEKLGYVIQGLRRLSFIIVVWNVFFVFLMVGVFAA